MVFSEKLKQLRDISGLTQDELGLKLGVTGRTIQNYESGSVYPKKREIYSQLAALFNTDLDYWLTEADSEESMSNKRLVVCKETVLGDVKKLFSDHAMDDEKLDQIMQSIQDVYRTVKKQSKNNSL